MAPHVVQFAVQVGGVGDRAVGDAGQCFGQPGGQVVGRQAGQQGLAQRARVGGQPQTQVRHQAHGPARVLPGQVDHIKAIERGQLHDLVAAGHEGAGRLMKGRLKPVVAQVRSA